jgi:DNA recombination protein RmuC
MTLDWLVLAAFALGMLLGASFITWQRNQKDTAREAETSARHAAERTQWDTQQQAHMARALSSAQEERLLAEHALSLQLAQAQTALTQRDTQLDTLTQAHQQLSAEAQTLREDRSRLATQYDTLQAARAQWEAQLTTQWQTAFQAFMADRLMHVDQHQQEQWGQAQAARETAFQEQLKQTLAPLQTQVTAYREQVERMELRQTAQQTSITDQIQRLSETTFRLATVLGDNKRRGDWGEYALRLMLEHAGLQEGVHFEAQTTVAGNLRPDVIVRLPSGRSIVVDAKALNWQWAEASPGPDDGNADHDQTTASAAHTETLTAAAAPRLVRSMREAIKSLTSRDYQAHLPGSADFVVLYVPREVLITQALVAEPALFEEAFRQKVILCGPMNLIALFKIVLQGWHQAELSQDAEKILAMAKDIYDRGASFLERMDKLGKQIEAVVQTFNEAQNTFTGPRGFFRQLQKLETYGAQKTTKKLSDAGPRMVDTVPVPVSPLA